MDRTRFDTAHLDYRFLTYDAEEDRDHLHHETIPVHLDHDREEIVIGIDLPYGAFSTDLSADWKPRIDYLPPLEDEEEVWRRLPELAAFNSDESRDRVIDILLNDVRDGYWHKPSSPSGNHHPYDERWQHGQWIHTKRVISTAYRNLRNASRMYHTPIDEQLVDHTLEAAVLHDMHKFGRDRELDETYGDHAITAAIDLEDHGNSFPEAVSRAVERHTGPQLYDGAPEPVFLQEHLLHVADATSAFYASETLLVDPAPELRFAQAVSRLRSRYHEDELLSYTVTARNPDHIPGDLIG